jgi:hypothetical protein
MPTTGPVTSVITARIGATRCEHEEVNGTTATTGDQHWR